MTGILIGLLLIAGVTVLLIPLVNNILTTETITIINDMLDNLEFFIGSKNITLLLCTITIILIIMLTRFFTKFFHVNND